VSVSVRRIASTGQDAAASRTWSSDSVSARTGWNAATVRKPGQQLAERLLQFHPGELHAETVMGDRAEGQVGLGYVTDSEIPVPSESSAAELRAFYTAWRSELTA
jgi:hypothetical protein